MATQKVVCDSDVMIDYFDERKKRHFQTKIELEKIGLDNVVLSAITKMELLKGTTNKRESDFVFKKLNRFSLILITPAITVRAMEFLHTYHLRHGLAIPDALIAATVIETKLTLFTYNIKDFKFIKNITLWHPARLKD